MKPGSVHASLRRYRELVSVGVVNLLQLPDLTFVKLFFQNYCQYDIDDINTEKNVTEVTTEPYTGVVVARAATSANKKLDFIDEG